MEGGVIDLAVIGQGDGLPLPMVGVVNVNPFPLGSTLYYAELPDTFSDDGS